MQLPPRIFDGLQLPALDIAGKVNETLSRDNRLVITAPPGAGKSTILPLTIQAGLKNGGKTIVLEPRRLAARSIAERMSFLLGEAPGRTVGYRIRFENRSSKQTEVEVVTERILTRMLTTDPTLDGVSCIIFDEFHERSIDSDLALALSLECQDILRPDLRIVVMSATIDAAGICTALKAPLLQSEGRMFPVRTGYCDSTPSENSITEAVAAKIRQALREDEGDILAFLPGEGEIRRCAELLGESPAGARVLPLYGMLPSAEQQRAIAPSRPGERKIVLATPIAETSLTIEGVRIVIDSGLYRKMVFNPQSSLSRLEVERISMDMARQRTGRAGRTAPGVCYRLWSKGTESQMKDSRTPEILDADLAPLVLDVASWSGSGVDSLPWLTPPPASHIKTARSLLESLGALETDGGISEFGRRIGVLPCHPRIAAMLASAGNGRGKSLACDLAALLDERDPAPEGSNADICARIDELRKVRRDKRASGRWFRIVQGAKQYLSMIDAEEDNSSAEPCEAGALLARAYPERIARSDGHGRFLMACGDYAMIDNSDPLSSYEWLAVASLSSKAGSDGRIFLAAPLDASDLKALSRHRKVTFWDSRRATVTSQEEWRIGRLLLDTRQSGNLSREEMIRIISEAAPKEGLSMFDFNDEVENLQRRIATAASWRPELELPDVSTNALLARTAEWLPDCIGTGGSGDLKKIDLCPMIWSLLDYQQQMQVEKIAPSHITVPTGSKIKVEYRIGADAPVVRVRLQECFGLTDTPTVDGGRRKVLMELLSPGFKPVQLTTDLRSFWQGTYFEVRKELRLRYPRHSWPEDPLTADAVRGPKKKQ